MKRRVRPKTHRSGAAERPLPRLLAAIRREWEEPRREAYLNTWILLAFVVSVAIGIWMMTGGVNVALAALGIGILQYGILLFVRAVLGIDVVPVEMSLQNRLRPLYRGLLRELERMEHNGASGPTREERADLCAVLERTANPSLAFYSSYVSQGILGALERSGDEETLETVWHIARIQADSHEQRMVVEAARRCEEAIRDRIEEARRTDRLLRPTAAPDCAETLLRPAHGAGAEAPERLLRPAGKEAAPGLARQEQDV